MKVFIAKVLTGTAIAAQALARSADEVLDPHGVNAALRLRADARKARQDAAIRGAQTRKGKRA